MTKTNNQFEGIQVLRFVAALLVVAMHSTHYAAERLTAGAPIFSNGSAGVDIFFVISGFVMVISSQSLIHHRDGWKHFALQRLIRIVPLYWLLLTTKVLFILFFPAALRDSSFDPVAIISSFLFLPSYNHEGEIAPILYVGWSLNFEMFFYALLAIAMAFRLNTFRFVGGVFLICCLLALLRTPDWPVYSFYFDTMVLEFGLGMLIGRACSKERVMPTGIALGLILLGILCLTPVWEQVPTLWRPVVWGIPAALIVLGIVGLERTFNGHYPRALLVLGSASYALYLIHPLVAPLIPSMLKRAGSGSAWLSIILSMAVSVLAALMAYYVAEKPLTQWFRQKLAA